MTVAETGDRSIALGGFMGVGKSTLGPLVAQAVGLPFVDLDQELERGAGQSCASLLRSRGEAWFRSAETRALAGVLKQGPIVLALGGGTLHQAENLRLLQGTQVVVLWAPLRELLPRLDCKDRPLAAAAAELFASRASGYKEAGLLVDVSECSPVTGAARVVAAVEGR